MEKANTIIQLEKEFKKIKSVVSEDTRFIAIGMMYIANKLTVERDKFHWLVDFLKVNNLVIGNREGKAFKELSFEELHKIYEDI